jgi:hypothetical protein
MPTHQWLKDNPKISAHIPQPLHEKLEAFMRDRGLQKTAQAVTLILTEYLSSSQLTTQSSPQLTTDESIWELVKQQVERALYNRELVHSSPPQDQKVVHSSDVKSPEVVHSCPLWLTTGEAHATAVRLGYRKSKTTFRRAIALGSIPAELEALGLRANWEFRKASHPKDNSVKWLRFEDEKL